MRLTFFLTTILTTLLAATTPASAQDAGGGSTTSYFKMFFISDDIIGQLIIFLLILMSVIAIGYMAKLFMNYRTSKMTPDGFYQEVEQLIADKKFREAIDLSNQEDSYLGKLVSSAMNEAANGYAVMERTIEETADIHVTKMLRPVEFLNVLGNISPMLGLFGTVYGMIIAFQKLVESTGRVEPQTLAAGISTALVTTLWGLIVAMPSLAGYAMIRNKIDGLSADGMVMAEQLIKPFRSSAGKKTAAGPATPKPEANA